MKPLRIAMIAGEISGDKLGAALLKDLLAKNPTLQCEGVGGEQLHAAGMQLLFHTGKISVMAIVEALFRYPRLKWLQWQLIRRWQKQPPDIFIGIDAPDFNLKIARALKRKGVRTIQYVSPKVWAWRSHRVALIKESIDAVLCIFPFEVDFYQKAGVQAHFVGHPLAQNIPLQYSLEDAKTALGLHPKDKILCLMPGSRKSEIRQHAALFMDVAQRMQRLHPNLKTVFALPNAALSDLFRALSAKVPHDNKSHIVLTGQSHDVLAAADAALIKSGTSTLEALCFKKPMAVVYRCHPISHAIIKRQLQIPWIALPNILAGKTMVKEFIQYDAKSENIIEELNRLLSPDHNNQGLIATYQTAHIALKRPPQTDIAGIILHGVNDAKP